MKLTAITDPMDARLNVKANTDDMRRALGKALSAITRRAEDYVESRNLLLDSHFETGSANGWSRVYGDHTIADSKYEKVFDSDTAASRIEKTLTLDDVGDFVYTISLKNTKRIHWRGFDGLELIGTSVFTEISTASFKTFSFRFRNTTPGVKAIRGYVVSPAVGDKVTIDWEKLERGITATAWTPAPEDIQAQIEASGEIPDIHPLPYTNPLPIRLDTTIGTRVFVGDTMVYGDTGWRDMKNYLVNGWTATSFRIKRSGDLVYWRVVGLNSTNATSREFMPATPGISVGEFMTTKIDGVEMQVEWNGVVRTASASYQGLNLTDYSLIMTVRSQSWPSTLPGLPD